MTTMAAVRFLVFAGMMSGMAIAAAVAGLF
jgi:hypothetical protein